MGEAVLVAGGAGFVGAYVVEQLVKAGNEVIVVDNCSRGQESNLPDGCLVVKEDIKRLQTRLRGLLEEHRVTTLYDFAARVYGVKDLYKNPAELLVDNVDMTRILLSAAAGRVKNYVYVSSSCVYDFEGAQVPHVETDLKPCDTSYGWSKLFGEALCRFFAQQYGFDYRILRLFNVFGARDSMQSAHVIPELTYKAWRVKQGLADSIPLIGDGLQTRDYTFIDDVVAGIIAVAEKGKSGFAYNVGTGREITVQDLARLIVAEVGLDPATVRFTHVPAPTEDIRRRAADVTRIFEHTGWAPTVTLEEGLRRVVANLLPRYENGQVAA
jgi:nucleoside-diphosphate-sugar epimerase